MPFNEDSRVKIPAILHLTRLGYKYHSLKGASWDQSSNIFSDLFIDGLLQINPDLDLGEIDRLLKEVSLLLDNEDLGKAFYECITNTDSSPEPFPINPLFLKTILTLTTPKVSELSDPIIFNLVG